MNSEPAPFRIVRLASYMNGVPQKQIARATAIPLVRVGRLLRGERKFRPGELEAMRRAVGLDGDKGGA